jgi:hypothetical protein
MLIVAVGGARFRNGVSLSPGLRTAEVYDLGTGRWQTLRALLPRGRATLTAAEAGRGTVLAIAGAIDVNGVETAVADVHALRL